MGRVIGLTGGIASGKSTVSDMIRKLGFVVVDADIAAKTVVQPGQPALSLIVETFGEDILNESGELDRPKLGSIVFQDEEKRLQLNSIVHPAVRKFMKDEQESAFLKGEKVVFLDIPLLFESNLTFMVEKILLVYVDKNMQLARLMKRNGFSEKEALDRISSQWPLKEKIEHSDAVINNNGTIEETKGQLLSILRQWDIID
ncbi:dephospho-CoA kinase [Peribacillus alkalitolerans]|uniref:dephospho-CoA kinase n=1 Tax=Peribacillus alkalitolerans TaxID=1550385 RepID=UPI0013D75E8E|nr:dephospho-CoA kinase [Peribacillus alkalitolerans]